MFKFAQLVCGSRMRDIGVECQKQWPKHTYTKCGMQVLEKEVQDGQMRRKDGCRCLPVRI